MFCVYILYLCNQKRQLIATKCSVQSSANAEDSCVLCVCVCARAEVSSAHLLPWDRGEGEERGAGAAHLRQVLGQHDIN